MIAVDETVFHYVADAAALLTVTTLLILNFLKPPLALAPLIPLSGR